MSSATSVKGGGGTVHLDLYANQKIKQPKVTEQKKLTGGGSVVRAEWEIKEFVWFSRFLGELDASYKMLLDRLDVDPDDYECEIGGFYSYRHERDDTRKCDVDRIFVPLVRAGRYHPYSSVKHRRRASARTLDRLEFLWEECHKRRVKFDYIVNIELTFPKQISKQWNDDDVQHRIRGAVKDFLRGLHNELFPNHDSQFGVICNHHYWSSKFPLEPHRHVHLTIPNVTYNKNTGMFHRFQPHIKGGLIRRVWKSALMKNDLWGDTPEDLMPDIYVVYKKFADRNKVIHRLSYCSRKPVEDMIRACKRDNNFSAVIKSNDFDEDFALFLLNFTPRVINLGFLTNLKRFGYSRKSIGMKCPICGGDMYLVRDDWNSPIFYDRPPPDVPRVYRSRSGKWKLLPSPDQPVGGV